MGSELCSEPWSVELTSALSTPHGWKVWGWGGSCPKGNQGAVPKNVGTGADRQNDNQHPLHLTPAYPSRVSYAITFPATLSWPCPCQQL